MIPVVSPKEMAKIDAAADATIKELIDRAGRAVLSHSLKMLGGQKSCRGKNVVVIAGKGNNGEDGRVAAKLLKERKISTELVEPNELKKHIKKIVAADLIIDAAYGTGLSKPYELPAGIQEKISGQVLAVDIPSGVDGLTGEVAGGALKADRTLTFGTLKSGQLLFPGSSYSTETKIEDIGLDVSSANMWLLTEEAVAAALPVRKKDAHKWNSACWVIGGSAGMTGSVSLAATAAFRAGSGYVAISVPEESNSHSMETDMSTYPVEFEARVNNAVGGDASLSINPLEAVGIELIDSDWGSEVLKRAERFKAFVVGPGFGKGFENHLESSEKNDAIENGSNSTNNNFTKQVSKILTGIKQPIVIDGDGLNFLAMCGPDILKKRKIPAVLTPHDGEFERLNGGEKPEANRVESARKLADKYNSIVLLKGATTLIAEPKTGKVIFSTTGDERLATAGTGDVLSGVIASFLAQGLEPFMAAAVGAYIHGAGAELALKQGFMASDLLPHIPKALSLISDKAPISSKM